MTVGKPKRIASIDSITNKQSNNYGLKLSGLVPTATGAWVSAPMLKQKNFIFQGVNYDIKQATLTQLKQMKFTGGIYKGLPLTNNRVAGPQFKINGIPKF